MSRDLKVGLGLTLDDSVEGELTVKRAPQTAQVSITYPTAPDGEVAVVGTGDTGLNPELYPGSFVSVRDEYQLTTQTGGAFTVLADGRVQVNNAGLVNIVGYADVSHTNNNSVVGIVFEIERGGSTILSPRTVHARVPNAGNIGNLSGNGLLSAQAGDIIGLAVASDKTGTVSFQVSSLVFTWVG